MRNSSRLMFVLGVLGAASFSLGQTTLLNDTFSRTGNLSGTSPDVVVPSGGTWTTYSSGYSGGNGNPNGSGTSYAADVEPSTDGNLATITGTYFHENTEAFIPFTPGASGELTATATIDSVAGTASWAFLALATSTSTPDVYNANSVAAWALAKFPAGNGGNYGSQLFIGAGTGSSGGSQVNFSNTQTSHSLVINYDPSLSSGNITASFDGNVVGTGTYSGTLSDIDGLVIGLRGASGGSPTNTGTATFDDVSVVQAPEPASLSLLAIGGLLAIRRRRA